MGLEGISFLAGLGVGAVAVIAYNEYQKSQPTGSLRGSTQAVRGPRGYMDVVGSKVPSHTVRQRRPGAYVAVF